MSRSFDYEGYWAIGKLYEHADANDTDEFVINLVDQFVSIDAEDIEFSPAIKLLSSILKRDLESRKIPSGWLRDVSITFKFDTEYKHKYHYWGSALGGKPFMYSVKITTDLGKTYSKECGCNVWVHNPKREQRRNGF